MKRHLASLVVTLAFTLSACGSTAPTQPTQPPAPTTPTLAASSMAQQRSATPTRAPATASVIGEVREAPVIATPTAAPTLTPRPTFTPKPTATSSATPAELTPEPTATASPQPTSTPVPPTPTPAPTESPEPVVTLYAGRVGGVAVYTSPRKDAALSVEIPGAAAVQAVKQPVVGADGESWYKVTYNGKTGYVPASLLSAEKAAPVAVKPRTIALPVLEYHEIDGPASEWNVPMPLFKAHLDWLQSAGFTTVSLDDVYDYTYEGGALPRRPLVITFDDGRLSHLAAGEELHRRGMKATFFVMGGGTLLSEKELKQLVAWGHDLQSHSMTHSKMKDLSDEELRYEVVESKRVLEKKYGVEITFFAWPFGTYSKEAVLILERAGYRGAIGNGGGGTWPLKYGPDNNWYQFRLIANGTWSVQEFAEMVEYQDGDR